ncbi:MAG TPA: flagellar type III secretion system pore protein FliP [Acidimicrobiales bacterium]|nr:flagellar type III secretion system pore protein FliP [Acidimicrobiales bacterium]
MPLVKLAVAVAATVLALLSLSSTPNAFADPAGQSPSPSGGAAATASTATGGTTPGGGATTLAPSTDQSPVNAPDISGYTTGANPGSSPTPVTAAAPTAPQAPDAPAQPSGSGSSGSTISVNLGGSLSKPSESLTILIGLTLLAVAPSLLILLTSFTRIIIVLSLTRQALGLQNVPPNQLLAGLALFLSLFIMSPVISQVNNQAVQPYLSGKITATQAYNDAQAPLKKWMLDQTQADDLAIFEHGQPPKSPQDVPMSAAVPAFALSEMRTAFIIGFVIFVPFLVIDLVVSATLMSLGMMMLPPSLVSLPFKLLLFVLVDGWALVVQSLISSFHP